MGLLRPGDPDTLLGQKVSLPAAFEGAQGFVYGDSYTTSAHASDLGHGFGHRVAERLRFGRVVMAPPSGLTATAVASGGTFAAGTYYWKITGVNARGETTASNEASVTLVLNGSATLAWSKLPVGTTGYRIYRGTAAGAENILVFQNIGTTQALGSSYTDTGLVGLASLPPVVNTASAPIVDRGVASTTMGQCLLEAAAGSNVWTPGTKGVVLLKSVINSVINVTSAQDAAERAGFPNALRTLLCLFRSEQWIPESHASCVTAGTWTTATPSKINGGSILKTVAPGATVTITTTASEITLMLLGFRLADATGSPFSITVNGNPYTPAGALTTVGQVTPVNASAYHHQGVRVTGLSGTSTIVLTKGAGAGELYFDGYLVASSTPPVVVVGKDVDLPAAGFAVNGVDSNRNAAGLAVYNGFVDSVCAEFTDGFVRVANPRPIWPGNGALQENVHPKDAGYAVYADAFVAALADLTTYRDGTFIPGV